MSSSAVTSFLPLVVAGDDESSLTITSSSAGASFQTASFPGATVVLDQHGNAEFRKSISAAHVRGLCDFRYGNLVMLDGNFADSALQFLRHARFARDLNGCEVRFMPPQPQIDGHAGVYAASPSCTGSWVAGNPTTGTCQGSTVTVSFAAFGVVPVAGDTLTVSGASYPVASCSQAGDVLTIALTGASFGSGSACVVQSVTLVDAASYDAMQLGATTAAAVHELSRAIRIVDPTRTRLHNLEFQGTGVRPIDPGNNAFNVYVSSPAAIANAATTALSPPASGDLQFSVTNAAVTSYPPLNVGTGPGQWTMTPTSGNLTFSVGSTVAAKIANNGTAALVNFTGVHRCFMPGARAAQDDMTGLVVVADQNDYVKMSSFVRGVDAIDISESLPIVSLSSKAKDKTVFGVIAGVEDERVDAVGAFFSYSPIPIGDTRVYVNSVGEGAVWVINTTGPIEAGDYLTTSSVPGYACLQADDDLMHNYTLAKATMHCDFTAPLRPKLAPTNRVDTAGDVIWEPVLDVDGTVIEEPMYQTRLVHADGTIVTDYAAAAASGASMYTAAFIGCCYFSG